MKVLVLFAFVVLGCSLARARTVTKCELRQQLIVAFSSLPKNVTVNGLTEDAFLAKVVCHAEKLSGFNTSAVTVLSDGKGKESQNSTESKSSKSKGKSSESKGKSSESKGKSSESNEDDEDVTLYGLFQLPNDMVCSSSNSPSVNFCDISCNKLTDDDISDDIICVVKVINELVTKNIMAKNSKELWEVIKKLVGGNCNNLDQYFSGC